MSLGGEACILKLKEEVYFLHDVVERVNKGVNMKTAYSWKFPGKSAFEIKIHSVLSKLNYCTTNKQSNEILHVLLLEIIIDRFLVIFQILSYLCKTYCFYSDSCYEDSNSLSSCVSEHVSVVNSLVNLVGVSRETKENSGRKCDGRLQETSHEILKSAGKNIAADAMRWIADIERFYNNSFQRTSKLSSKNDELETKSQETQTEISEIRSENYSQVFSSMIQVLAKCLVKPMDIYNLPSETGRFIREVMNFPNGDNWELDVSKSIFLFLERDTSRLIKYLEVQSSSKKRLEDQVNLMRNENVQLHKEIVVKQNELNHLNEKLSKEVRGLSEKTNQLNEENTKLKINAEDLTKTLENKEFQVLELENQCQVMKKNINNLLKLCDIDRIDLNDTSLPSNPSRIIECYLLELQRKLETTTNEYQCITKLLDEKEVENQNMNSQYSVITTNYEQLTIRINQLTDLNEQLKQQILQKDHLIEQLNNDLTYSNKKINELEQTKLESEQFNKKLNEMNEILLQMAQYPDLNGPIIIENENIKEKSVDEELKGQIQANEHRITLLTEQTKRLRNALLLLNNKKQNMNTNNDENNNHTEQSVSEDMELLSPETDYLLLANKNNDTNSSSSQVNSVTSFNSISSENQSVKEDNSCGRQKTYTKSVMLSNEINNNHSNVQLWCGPRKGSSRSQCKRKTNEKCSTPGINL
ncbi:hypothetical protein MN116_005616 [Schistosoma mekongi]|uniref:Uncharacterized protein n=1 Tax=Schistosoma mekongi TaxID=38744 RepID=A0AAE2D3T7_SCHME|nr:hypothetical protein MN116_005616 [Schistosoma mekongi]